MRNHKQKSHEKVKDQNIQDLTTPQYSNMHDLDNEKESKICLPNESDHNQNFDEKIVIESGGISENDIVLIIEKPQNTESRKGTNEAFKDNNHSIDPIKVEIYDTDGTNSKSVDKKLLKCAHCHKRFARRIMLEHLLQHKKSHVDSTISRGHADNVKECDIHEIEGMYVWYHLYSLETTLFNSPATA